MNHPTSNSDGPRLAVVVSHPTQYYSPWFRWLAHHAPLQLRVFYLSDTGMRATHDEKFGQTFSWDVDLTSGYSWELVPNVSKTPDTLRFHGLDNPALPARLRAWQPAAILLFGYNYRTHLRLIAWARMRRVPLIFRGDSHDLGRPQPGFRHRWLLSILYRQFSAITYVGLANRDYFRLRRVPDRKLFFAPHAVDASLFDLSRPDLSTQVRELRSEMGIPPGNRVILFAGKLIESKQPLLLLQAFLQLQTKDCSLVFVGDGPLRETLVSTAAARPGLPVHFLPFANQSEMPARYALADLVVLPSASPYETWGLVVNEAMHMGKPALVSDQVGCHRDLIEEGVSGWVFPAADLSALVVALDRALKQLHENPAGFKAAVAERIRGYSYAQAASGLTAAVDYALGRSDGESASGEHTQ